MSNRRPDSGRFSRPDSPLSATRQTLRALVTNDPEETDVFHEAIVTVRLTMMRMGAIASALTALVIFASGLFTGSTDQLLESITPAIVAALFGWQAWSGGRKVVLSLILSLVSVVITYPLVGTDATLLPASLALVIIGGIGLLFVDTGRLAYVIGVGAVLVLAGFLWVEDGAARVATAATIVTGFGLVALIMLSVRMATLVSASRYVRLFEDSPVALLEQDWGATLRAVENLGINDPQELGKYLLAHPAVVTDLAAGIVYVRVNAAAAELLGLDDPAALVGPMSTTRVNETSIEALVSEVVAMVEGRLTFECTYETVTFNGDQIWIEVRWIRPLRLRPNPDRLVIAIHDITEEMRVRGGMAELIRSKDEFIASVSHELRTPLTAVVGLAGELAHGHMVFSDSERAELLELIAGQSREMAFIVEDLLVAARADINQISIAPERINVAENVDRIVTEFGWDNSITRPSGDCEVLADPVRFRQIVRNLIANAHRYGGKSRRIVGRHDGDVVTIEVRDDGPGIPDEDRERIFEPYARAHNQPGVTASVGLGLAVSRRLAKLMAGDLVYDFDEEHGEAVFRLTLPSGQPGMREVSCS
ncbi:MAG: ATP-binding protein [Acidimicrobiia bacterium]|nr:ATP-binding protein [Acidimicrobiia bacterium]